MGYIVKGNLGSDKVDEQDCIACEHCRGVILLVHYQAQGGWCNQCGKPICYQCAEHANKVLRCEPWNKQMDDLEDAMWKARAAKLGGIVI